MYVCESIHHAYLVRFPQGPELDIGTLELKLQIVVSRQTQVLETELRSPRRAGSKKKSQFF